MDKQPRIRLIFALLAMAGLAFTLYNWNLLVTEGRFYPKGAILFPALTPFFVVLAIFPALMQAPQPVAVKWRIVMVAGFVLGVVLGLYNYSLMSNYRPH